MMNAFMVNFRQRVSFTTTIRRATCSINVVSRPQTIKAVRYSTTVPWESETEKRYIEECEKQIDDETKEETRFMGWNALHWAAFKGNTEVVSNLIKSRQTMLSSGDLQVFKQDIAGVSPLHLAVERGHSEVVDKLLTDGCDPNVRDIKQNFRLTPLHLAVRHKNPNINIIASLIKHGANVNQEATDKTTPLFKACASGRTDIVALLLKNGANINIQNNPRTTGWGAYRVTTPLHLAVSSGFEEIVTILIQYGADVNYNLMDDVGETPLHVAATVGQQQIASVLLKNGANVNSLDCFGGTPLDYAESSGDKSKNIADLLVSHGAVKGKGKRL